MTYGIRERELLAYWQACQNIAEPGPVGNEAVDELEITAMHSDWPKLQAACLNRAQTSRRKTVLVAPCGFLA